MILRIFRPSEREVDRYLKRWDRLESYTLQESSLKKLFTKTYPLNSDIDDVLIKVCSLNDFYSTNIFSPYTIAKHIIKLKIDNPLAEGSLKIVNQIAKVKMNGGKIINFYSFATKYCSHHRPTVYPIYDSYVDQLLWYFRKNDNFSTFEREDLKVYGKFLNILKQFSEYYNLESFNLKQIDKYLWQAGKHYFPKDFGVKPGKRKNEQI